MSNTLFLENVSMNITYGNSLYSEEEYPLMENRYLLPEGDVATQKYYLYVFIFFIQYILLYSSLLLFSDPPHLPTNESSCAFNPYLTPVGAEKN